MNQQWNCHWCYMRVVSLQKLPQTAHKPQQTTNPPLCNKLIKSNSYRLLLETTVIFTQKLVTFWQQMSPFSSWELFAESSRSSQTWESKKIPSSLFMTSWASCRILTASLIHRVVRSNSQPIIVASSQVPSQLCPTSTTTYYSPRLQLQRLLLESSQFEKGDIFCRNVTNFR